MTVRSAASVVAVAVVLSLTACAAWHSPDAGSPNPSVANSVAVALNAKPGEQVSPVLANPDPAWQAQWVNTRLKALLATRRLKPIESTDGRDGLIYTFKDGSRLRLTFAAGGPTDAAGGPGPALERVDVSP